MADELKFEAVERPGSEAISDPLVNALAETVESGKAIKLNLGSQNMINFQSTLRNRLKKLDPPLRLRYKWNKATKDIVLWAENPEEERDIDDAGPIGTGPTARV